MVGETEAAVNALRDGEVKNASDTLLEVRGALFSRLMNGTSGTEVIRGFTQTVDGLITGRYRNAVRKVEGEAQTAGTQHCCIVALGGYGRRELAPYSDIDLMFLFRPEATQTIQALSREVLHHLWDLGFQVGHSVRTIHDCLQLSAADFTIRTSLLEARYLAGSSALFQEFQRRYVKRVARRRSSQFIQAKMEERGREYQKFGETVYLLEPNVKKSQGGLRDLHLIQWLGTAKYHVGTIQGLADRGVLSRKDYLALTEAREFLWRIRALLHLHAGMAQEILSFDEQVWLAQHFGFSDQPHLLAVEQFMQQYYRHTGGLHEACDRFVDRCRKVSWMSRVARFFPAQRLAGHFVVAGNHLTVPADSLNAVRQSPELLLQLFEVAQARQLRIDTALLDEIHEHLTTLPEEAFRTSSASRLFLRILSGPQSVAETLEAMHRAHLLEKMIPVFARVRGLMQFNQYHKYTVDEHSLLAVAKAETYAKEASIFGEVYREIHRRDLLHLAILLHDLGKGLEHDHSEVGKAIAEETAARLGFDEQETRTLSFLVHRHLLMANTALRRDPYDEKVLLSFTRDVGTPEVLRKLFVLTAADIAAVGPGVLTKWKESLLIELYLRAMPRVSGERETVSGPERLKRVTGNVALQPALGGMPGVDESWIESQLVQFPLRYAYGTAPDRIAAHLAAIRRLKPGQVLVEDSYNAALGTCEYTVVTFNNLTPGLFSKIAGVMASKGLPILDAQILTRSDGIVVDTFQVLDPDQVGPPPQERRASVARTIVRILNGEDSVENLLSRSHRLPAERQLPARRLPSEVQVDNETSDRFTLIDVFADDRQGLLYVITHAIVQLGLSVHAARISTRLDQVADVFYVTDAEGGKVVDASRLEMIRTIIRKEIDQVPRDTTSKEQSVS